MEVVFIIACIALLCLYTIHLIFQNQTTETAYYPEESDEGYSVYEWVDSTTGVTYFISTAGGIYPKLNVDGSLFIEEK